MCTDLQCPGCSRYTLKIPLTSSICTQIVRVLTILRSCKLECNCSTSSEVRELTSCALIINHCTRIHPVVSEHLVEVINVQEAIVHVRRLERVDTCIELLTIENILILLGRLYASLCRVELEPVRPVLIANITILEVQLLTRNLQGYPDRGTILLVDEADNSRNLIRACTLSCIVNT